MKYRKTNQRVHFYDWEIGKVYFLEGGHSPFVLVETAPCAYWNTTDECNYRAEYISGVEATGTKTYLIKAEEIEGDNDMTKLYEVKEDNGNTLYAHKLAKNSAGQWVMEIKGSGKVIAVDASKVEEVLPYTISINFEEGGQNYSYLSEAGVAEVGDLFLFNAPSGRSIVQVTGVDTKSKSATKEFKPLGKLMLDNNP